MRLIKIEPIYVPKDCIRQGDESDPTIFTAFPNRDWSRTRKLQSSQAESATPCHASHAPR